MLSFFGCYFISHHSIPNIFPAKIINSLSFVFLPISLYLMRIKNHIPNLVTLLNLISGSIAIILGLFRGNDPGVMVHYPSCYP